MARANSNSVRMSRKSSVPGVVVVAAGEGGNLEARGGTHGTLLVRWLCNDDNVLRVRSRFAYLFAPTERANAIRRRRPQTSMLCSGDEASRV